MNVIKKSLKVAYFAAITTTAAAIIHYVYHNVESLGQSNVAEPDPYARGEDLVTCYTQTCSAGMQ